jgi:hypothetical protein
VDAQEGGDLPLRPPVLDPPDRQLAAGLQLLGRAVAPHPEQVTFRKGTRIPLLSCQPVEAKNRSNELPDLKGNFTDAFVLHSLCHAACQSEKLIQVPDGGAIWGLVFLRLSARLTPLIRDIFGNPFRPVVIDPAWLTPAVIELAQAIYSDRSSERAAEIAGLLKNAGCTNDCILEHCLSTQPHFRGCWVIDAMLARQ